MLDSKQTLSRLAAPVAVYPQVLKNVRVSDKAAVARITRMCRQVVKAVGERLGDTGRVSAARERHGAGDPRDGGSAGAARG